MNIKELLPKEKFNELELIFRSSMHFNGVQDYLRKSAIAGAVLFLAVLAVLLYVKADSFYITIIPFCVFFFPVFANYIIAYYIFDTRRKSIERHVPDLLLHAASFPRGTSISAIIKNLGRSDYAELSDEFRKAHTEILKGQTPEKAFRNMKQRNRSKVLERAVDLIVDGMNSGADAGSVF